MRYLLIRLRRYLSFVKSLFFKFRILHLLFGFISFRIKAAKSWGYPGLVQIEPTNICNLSCKLCPTGQRLLPRPPADMTFKQFKAVIDSLGRYMSYLILYVAGEPLLNKEIFRMTRYAKAKNIYIRFSTNATKDCFKDGRDIRELINSGIDELIIALDCLDRESYKEYKGDDGFDEVAERIHRIIEERGRRLSPFVNLQLIVTSQNEDRLPEFMALGKRLKVDNVLLKTVCVNLYGFKDKQAYLPAQEKYIRKVYLSNNTASCCRPWISTTVLSDGSVVPCCFDMSASMKFGNIFFEEDFRKIWKGSNYAQFRAKIAEDTTRIGLCKDCPGKNIPQNFIKLNQLL